MILKKKFEEILLSDVAALVRAQTRRVYTVFLHCSAADAAWADNAETMDKWHKARGWREIGYSAYVQKDGTIQMGRDWNTIPAAQRGYNQESLAICAGGLDVNKFTAAQLDAIAEFCYRLDGEFNRQKGYHLRFRGHREVAAKACPVYDYKALLNLDKAGNIGATPSEPPTQTAPPDVDEQFVPDTLRIFDRGPSVKKLQARLNSANANPKVDVDGIFGRGTLYAVKHFQVRNKLHPDGIVGPKTWKKLQKV